MKVILQRVSQASVLVDDKVIGAIKKGYLLLVGVGKDDTEADCDYLARKVSQMRLFEDDEGKTNLDLEAVNGSILSISQFTLLANTKKGNRPSFIHAASPELGEKLYEYFNDSLINKGHVVEKGEFGALMQVSLINDGPATIILDSKDK